MEFASMYPARWLPEQNFATCVPPHDFPFSLQDMQSSYYRPWQWHNQTMSKGFGSTIENEKGNCKITLDVQYFRPSEISVKVSDYEIIVEGRHEERPDTHGFVTRQFKRRYPLPNHCFPESVTSTLSSDGVLTIIAEKKSTLNQAEKIVPIKLCGTFPRKSQVESKTSSEITHKAAKEDIKQGKDERRDNHSRLLRPELLNEIISETNGSSMKTDTKQSIDIIKTSEKMAELNTGSTSNKIEECLEKSISGLTALTEQLGQKTIVRSKMDGTKIATEVSGMKTASEIPCPKMPLEMSGVQITADLSGTESMTGVSGKKSTSERSSTKNISEVSGIEKVSEICGMKNVPEILGVKCASEISGLKSTSETSGMKSASEISGIKKALEMSEIKSVLGTGSMTKTLIEESSSSYTSSSSMLSSMNVSGNNREHISDIRKELKKAAENV